MVRLHMQEQRMSDHILRGRFAPTPSGRMHLGNLAALLIAWLEARSAGGEFVLRIEDLDRERCRPEYTDRLLRDLEMLGFDYDGKPLYQSTRGDYYAGIITQLGKRANIYECFCSRAELHAQPAHIPDPDANAPHSASPVYSGRCRDLTAEERASLRQKRTPAIRIEVPDAYLEFTDLRLGRIYENLARDCGDFILRRSDGGWAYQLAVVADDAAQNVTQVVRGRDLVSSTPRQIWLFGLLGVPAPEYMHIPLLLAPDGRRLSKRERSLELGALLQTMSPAQIVGMTAWLLGLCPSPEPVTPSELVKVYCRGNIPADDIVMQDLPALDGQTDRTPICNI